MSDEMNAEEFDRQMDAGKPVELRVKRPLKPAAEFSFGHIVTDTLTRGASFHVNKIPGQATPVQHVVRDLPVNACNNHTEVLKLHGESVELAILTPGTRFRHPLSPLPRDASMTRACPSCRTLPADYDHPLGLCDECAADCDDCADGSLCAACGDDAAFSEARDARLEALTDFKQGE